MNNPKFFTIYNNARPKISPVINRKSLRSQPIIYRANDIAFNAVIHYDMFPYVYVCSVFVFHFPGLFKKFWIGIQPGCGGGETVLLRCQKH